MKNTEFTPEQRSCETPPCAPLPYMSRRKVEKRLMALLEFGDPQLFSKHLEETLGKVGEKWVGHAADVPLTQAKYQGTALVSRACRIAVEAGVPEQTAHAIRDTYMQIYDEMENSAGQWEIARKVLAHFCEAMHAVKFCSYSPAVRQCCEYIHLKICSSISLDELGKVCNLSAHYVSDLFRKELGFGALQYAHQVKLQYAKYLIENSDLGISEIASMLSYPSHSNFSQRFKKTYGVTPHEYRITCGS